MKLRQFLRWAFWVLCLLAVVMVVMTFVSWNYERLEGKRRWLPSRFDLRYEGNAATWFETILFFVCGMTFACLGWSPGEAFRRFRLDRWIYRLGALASFFFSLDEASGFHEYVGRTLERKIGVLQGSAIEGHGYGWVVVYLVPCVAGVAVLCWRTLRVLRQAPEPRGVRMAKASLLGLLLAAVALFVLEVVQGYLAYHGQSVTISACFEESCEVFLLLCLTYAHLCVARAHDL